MKAEEKISRLFCSLFQLISLPLQTDSQEGVAIEDNTYMYSSPKRQPCISCISQI